MGHVRQTPSEPYPGLILLQGLLNPSLPIALLPFHSPQPPPLHYYACPTISSSCVAVCAYNSFSPFECPAPSGPSSAKRLPRLLSIPARCCETTAPLPLLS